MDENAVAEPLLRAWLSGENMTRAKAMQIPYVAGAINEIAKTVANIPIGLYRKEGKKVIEIADDPRVFLLNEETGDTLDANQMKQAVVRDYVEIVRSGHNITFRFSLPLKLPTKPE